ncbi:MULTISPECIES: 8-amino-7-oxononanoate synthase [Caulobacter]|jgi:8-amino-7-oxononanoate synthase|uniref:8-amino-7-ketopelargonate synthase n=1 Tax=Caulobacter vibrioides OR37 TaxID=1292034 RepID=R0CY73_CAUVI|nr:MULTISPECIES: 8-amino-7-oxononanoate synthase [Caulobacter]ENZ81431.1 8-amino-7-oxononanoate synthase [Caulobacter vibrioides OR37]MBQ1560684.1 8-amino-7-oxononanoate synthase [Caulobacter sp.]
MQSLEAFADEKLASLDAKSLRRRLKPSRRHDGAVVERDGRRLISFSCNDYLGMAHHPLVRAAAAEAALNYGAGAAASRLVTGDHPLLSDLEKGLARLKGTEAACVFGSGYLANLGVIPTLVGPGDVILVDALAHACIWAGAQLSGARIVPFAHNDMADLERRLGAERPRARRALVATDGVFSMDGDIAPLDQLSVLCQAHDAWLLSDDAHGVGVLAQGRGSGALFPEAKIPLQMGTLSKALGSYGGYLCGSRAVVDLLKTRARTLVYATGLPPASAGAALAALDIINADPGLTETPLAKARLFTRRLGLPDAESPIVPVIFGGAEAALAASAALENLGFLVVAIRPPTVPEGTARLRLAFSAVHDDADVIRLADAIAHLRKVAA